METPSLRNGFRQSGSEGTDLGMAYVKQESKGRRLSKAGPRSRSDTVTSTSSVESTPSPLSSPKNASRHNSLNYDDDISTTLSYQYESKASKSLFSRGGRVLKRQGSKFSLLTVTEDRSEEPFKFSLANRETFKPRSKSTPRQSKFHHV